MDRMDINSIEVTAPPIPAATVVMLRDGAAGLEVFLLRRHSASAVLGGVFVFPGGKLEVGETIAQALKRELQEEIGITIEDCMSWKTEQIDYPHALVQLNFCKVRRWSGELQMREAQLYAWQQLPVTVKPVLPGTLPVLEWFAKERSFVGRTVAE